MPPKKQRQWTEETISPDTAAAVDSVFDWLLALEPATDPHGEPMPLDHELSPEGRRTWISYYNQHAQEQVALSGDLAAAWSKLEGYAARLALVIHLVRAAAGDPTLHDGAIDEASITVGIVLSRWFGDEAARVYSEIGGSLNPRKPGNCGKSGVH